MKTWICTTLASFFGLIQGAARLYVYLKKQGHDVSLKDLNQDTYFSLLSREYLLTLGWQIYPLYVLERSPLVGRAVEFGLSATPLPDDFLSQAMEYEMKTGLSQKESMISSIRFCEKLRRFLHPLHKIMDTESHKILLLAQKSKGITPDRIKVIVEV